MLLDPFSFFDNPVRLFWKKLKPYPGGKRAFSRLVGLMAPYSGSLNAQVQELDEGYARLALADRRALRNHLDCIHAIALINLGEMTSGLAMTYGLGKNMRGIVTKLSTEFIKKARGDLIGECHCDLPREGVSGTREVTSVILNNDGEAVARIKATWLIGPRR